MKYLKKFDTHANYETYINDDPLLPNVSYCEDIEDAHHNPFKWDNEYLTFVALEDTTFQITKNGASYSTDDGNTWTSISAYTATPTITAGNKIKWKGEITPAYNVGVGTFSATGQFNAQGNPMSLLLGDNFKKVTDLTGKDNAFTALFKNNTKLINAQDVTLPATTLTTYCYSEMFRGCVNLITVPKLPATTLVNNCYFYMFNGCTSLTTAPELPATTLANSCYARMFQGCSSLTTAPVLPVTMLETSCYSGMFQGCSSLTTAPVLPATTLVTYCYNCMFQDCTSLTTAPVLPATTLAHSCYRSMFQGCSSLTTAPVLPATTSA